MHNLFDVEAFFKSSLESIGHPLDGKLIFDTTDWQRYPCPHSKRSKKSSGYRAHSNGVPTIKVSCMKCGINQSFSYSKSYDQLTPIQQNSLRNEIEQNKAKQAKQASEERERVLAEINELYFNAAHCLNHPYLEAKQVTLPAQHNLRLTDNGTLLCPVFSIERQLISVQRIFWDDNANKFLKLFYKGSSPRNGGLTFGDVAASHAIYFAEGIATALTIYEATDCAVICTYGKHFDDLSFILHQSISDKPFVYCCDLPSINEKITSADNARKAISCIGGSCVLPDFSNIPDELSTEIQRSDFNDLFVLLMANRLSRSAALSEIQRQLSNINHGEDIMTYSEAALHHKAQDDQPIDLPASLPDVSIFNPEMLPETLKNFVLDVADRQQCPIDFVAVSAICGLAALLGRKALISPKQNDDWVITPNLWGTLIGRPSAMKSPAMKAALLPLYKIEREALKEYKESVDRYKFDKEMSDLKMDAAKQNAKKQLKNNNDEDAKATILNAMFTESPPIKRQIIVNDTTVEKLGVLLNENTNGLIHIRDELSGWIARLSDEKYQQDRSFYIECFDGDGSYKYERITRESVIIENLTLSLLGGIQPSKISPLVRNTIRGIGDDGLIQRLQLATWPDDKRKWMYVDKAPNEIYLQEYERLFDFMYKLRFAAFNQDSSPIFHFTPEAQELFVEWFTENNTLARSGDIHPALESHLLKTPKIIASLALIFELSNLFSILPENVSPVFSIEQTDEIVSRGIGVNATLQALEWADYLKSHAIRLYSSATHQSLEGAKTILNRIDKLTDTFTAREILRKQWCGLTDEHVIKEALNYLADYLHIYQYEVSSTDKGGRPTTQYRKNPVYIKKDTN